MIKHVSSLYVQWKSSTAVKSSALIHTPNQDQWNGRQLLLNLGPVVFTNQGIFVFVRLSAAVKMQWGRPVSAEACSSCRPSISGTFTRHKHFLSLKCFISNFTLIEALSTADVEWKVHWTDVMCDPRLYKFIWDVIPHNYIFIRRHIVVNGFQMCSISFEEENPSCFPNNDSVRHKVGPQV